MRQNAIKYFLQIFWLSILAKWCFKKVSFISCNLAVRINQTLLKMLMNRGNHKLFSLMFRYTYNKISTQIVYERFYTGTKYVYQIIFVNTMHIQKRETHRQNSTVNEIQSNESSKQAEQIIQIYYSFIHKIAP